MTTKPALRIVAPSPPTREARIRALLAELDHAEAVVAKTRAAIAEEGKLWVREQGEFVAPSLERLRRELLP